MDTPDRYVVCCTRLVTCTPTSRCPDDPLGMIPNAAMLVEGDRIGAVGPRADVLARADGAPIVLDVSDAVMTPGLVDAHTHLAWAGSRHDEYVLRMQGAGYEAIAASGGGIVSTMRAVREASEDTLALLTTRRLRRMASLGTTTCEVKSGYGLSLEAETKQLRAIARAAGMPSVPRVIPTFLPLHALPPEAREDRASWVHEVCEEWVARVAENKLACFVDAYIDRNAFTVDEARALFAAAQRAGLGIRAHVGQFADVGGAALAASFGAASVDHMENVGDDALSALARSGTHVVLLPMASFTLRQQPPPVPAFRAAGIPMVLASDANPGSAPTESLPMALALALHSYGLKPEECLLGATRHAAASLGLQDTCGALAAGLSADFVIWDVPHERAILQPWGSPITRWVVGRGRSLHEAGA